MSDASARFNCSVVLMSIGMRGRSPDADVVGGVITLLIIGIFSAVKNAALAGV